MTQLLDKILDAKQQQVHNYHTRWVELQGQLEQLLTETATEERALLQQFTDSLQQAIQHFCHELHYPHITLAATGTTSGGKSSLVNLLCGAEIMPVAVLEMSAGTVIIDHHPTQRSLKIPFVPGLPAEYSGEWMDISDHEMRLRLQRVMDGYRQLRDENREPPAPRIEIRYPTRIGMHPAQLGLPEGFQLRIIDLPGLKYIADEFNKQIIREEIRPALCLVTYNSEEVDPFKQQELLREVVDQVRELRGSPSRMLFVLNRIDVFRRDLDWEEQTHKFTEKTTNNISSMVAQALPEYQRQARQIRAHPLSTYPALCAYQTLTGPRELSVQAMERIDSKFNFLIPEEMDHLPRKVSHWSDHDLRVVGELVWRASYGHSFDQMLRQHIEDNVPQLLIPHLVKPIVDLAGERLITADQIIYAHIRATEDRYTAECERLQQIGHELQEMREQSKQQLLSILNLSDEYYDDEQQDYIGKLVDSARDLQQVYNLPKDSMVPLYDWSLQLGRAIDQFLSITHDAIIERQSKPGGELIESLPPKERELLSQTLANLHDSGYDSYVSSSGKFMAKTLDEKNQLHRMNQALNDLAEVLATNLRGVLKATAERETERICDALQVLLEEYADSISHQAKIIAPELAGLAITPSRLVRIRKNLLLNFQLEAGFPVYTNEEEVLTSYEKIKVGEKRLWYTLWIAKRNVYEERPIYTKRPYDEAVIPNLGYIFDKFIQQAKRSRHEADFASWLRSQIVGFLGELDLYQCELIEEYRRRLDQVRQRAAEERDLDIECWKAVSETVAELQAQLAELPKVS